MCQGHWGYWQRSRNYKSCRGAYYSTEQLVIIRPPDVCRKALSFAAALFSPELRSARLRSGRPPITCRLYSDLVDFFRGDILHVTPIIFKRGREFAIDHAATPRSFRNGTRYLKSFETLYAPRIELCPVQVWCSLVHAPLRTPICRYLATL